MSGFDMSSLGAPVGSEDQTHAHSHQSTLNHPTKSTIGTPYSNTMDYQGARQTAPTLTGASDVTSLGNSISPAPGSIPRPREGGPELVEQEHLYSDNTTVNTGLRYTPPPDTTAYNDAQANAHETARARHDLIAHVQDPNAGLESIKSGQYNGGPAAAEGIGGRKEAYSDDTVGAGGGVRSHAVPYPGGQKQGEIVHSAATPSEHRDQNSTTLPTAPDVHPAAQSRALAQTQRDDPELVAREVEKAKAGEREMKGEMPKGTVVEGIEDDRLWALLRRFDVQVTHAVISTSHNSTAHTDEPDLRRSTLPSIPYNNDVLRSNIERMYSTMGIVVIRSFNEVTRLRSWSPEERNRTGAFAGVYFLAWIFGMAIPTVIAFLIVLVVNEESRTFFFPPIPPPEGTPPSATDPTNKGGDQSLLGGVDSEVVHRSRSEQVEEQAWEFRQLAEGFAVKMAVAKGGKAKQGNANVGAKDHHVSSSSSSSEDEGDLDNLPAGPGGIDPDLYAPGEHPLEVQDAHQKSLNHKGIDTGNATGTGGQDSRKPQGLKGKTQVVEHGDGSKERKPLSEKERKKEEAREAKAKRDQLISKSLKMLQDGMGDTADMFECLVNAMAPPPPFPPTLARYKLAGGILVPLMILTAVVPAWIWAKAGSFAFGFAFFGQPVIDRSTVEIKRLLEKVPNWRDYLDLRNSLLSGVPTNDQLVLHLLRVGERANCPLPRPPPPPLAGTPKEAIKDTAPDPSDDLVDSDGEPITVNDLGATDRVKHQSKTGIVGAFKGLSRKVAGIGADVTVDGVRKKIGTRVDRIVFGGLLHDDGDDETYPCRLEKKLGHLYLEPTAGTGGPAIVSFKGIHDPTALFERSVNDLVEIKKGGVSVPRAVLGWVSGAEIESQTLALRFLTKAQRRRNKLAREHGEVESEEGEVYEVQAMVRREQAFVRLLSMGSSQRWESV